MDIIYFWVAVIVGVVVLGMVRTKVMRALNDDYEKDPKKANLRASYILAGIFAFMILLAAYILSKTYFLHK